MKYFVSFSQMDADFASKAAIDRPETIDEMEERRAMLFENSAFFHRVVGLWPKEDQVLGRFRSFKCHAGIFSTIAIALMQYSVLAINEDKSRTAELCIETALATAAFMKILPCVINRKMMIELHQRTRDMSGYLKESSAEKKIAYKWLSLQTKLISNIIVSYVVLVAIYFMYPMYRGDQFPIPVVIRFLAKLPWSAFMYIYEFIVSSLRIIAMISCDIYLVIFMCHLCSELQIVGNAMLEIEVRDKRSIYRAIKKHKRVLEYGQLMCNELSSSIVVQHLGMSLGVCFTAISVLYTKNQAILVKFVSIGSILALEVLLLCFVGETITGESLRIAEHLENKFEGFLDDAESLKTISFMLLRAQRPLSLRVGINTIINLNLFRLTMNKIFSCIVILKRAMVESDNDQEKQISLI